MDHRVITFVEMAAELRKVDLEAALRTIAEREDMVLVPRAAYARLVEDHDDLADRAAFDEFDRKLASGEEELLPAAMVRRLAAGENPVRVWREHRGMTAAALAERADVSPSYLSEIERGAKPGSVAAMKALAAALGVSMDDLV